MTFYHDYGQDTFIFWPVAGNERLQIEGFAKEVVPAEYPRNYQNLLRFYFYGRNRGRRSKSSHGK